MRGFVSPWAIGGVVLWLVVLVVVTQWAIPVFANVGSGPPCEGASCPTAATTEWLPSLVVAAIAASLVVAALWGAFAAIRRLH
jgi:hypothetical protein